MKRRKDSGFAMLLVALMAALLALSLYMELPRIALQSQRAKEQILIERGEEYKHAIGLFLRANKNTRWPATLDELESFNGQRFLRHRYKDPMTGKDEWRLIHINNGVLQDSVTNKKPGDKDQAASGPNGFIGELAGLGQQPTTGPGANMGLRRRPSDTNTSVGPDGQPVVQDPNAPPPPPGSQPNPQGGPFPGQFPGQNPLPGQNPIPGQNPGIPGATPLPPGVPGFPTPTPNQPPNGQPPFPGATGFPGNPQQPPNLPGTVPPGMPGMPITPQGAPNAAASMINNILTTPRPGGMAGLNTGSNVVGGGIAGVASTADAEGIMVYGDRTNYGEWEFIYDPTKYKAPPNPNQIAIGTSAQQITNQIGAGSQQPGQPALGGGGGAAGATGGTGSTGGPGGTTGTGAPPGAGTGFGSGGAVTIRPGKQ